MGKYVESDSGSRARLGETWPPEIAALKITAPNLIAPGIFGFESSNLLQQRRVTRGTMLLDMQPIDPSKPTAAGLTPKLNVRQAARYLGLSKSYLDKLRLTGGGPPFLRLGRRILYDHGDLENWAAKHRCTSTSRAGLC
jgi:hypothetical protein